MEKLEERKNAAFREITPAQKGSPFYRGKGYYIPKRVVDVFCSCIALICLSPVFLITAIAIKAESAGPVFFFQDRVGKNKRVFKMYKFRSMRTDAPELHQRLKEEYGDTSGSFKIKDDPRITKVGKVIRKLSIDELPQLINIIKGDMSIVGPRPLPTYEAEDLPDKYNDRFLALPGLTCTWQISGRSEISFEQRMKLDIDYVKERSFWNDIGLIFRTIPAVITGKGAY